MNAPRTLQGLAGEALQLIRRFEKTSGLSRAIRRPGVAPEWWREVVREAQADFWDATRDQPDRQRHIMVSRALSGLASGEPVTALKAPSTESALTRWLDSHPHRRWYVEAAAHLEGHDERGEAPASPEALKDGYGFEFREVFWILEAALLEIADLPSDDPRLRRRDPSDEAAERSRQIRRALQGDVPSGNGRSRAPGKAASLRLVG